MSKREKSKAQVVADLLMGYKDGLWLGTGMSPVTGAEKIQTLLDEERKRADVLVAALEGWSKISLKVPKSVFDRLKPQFQETFRALDKFEEGGPQ